MIFNFFSSQSTVVKLLYPTLVLRIQEQHIERRKIRPIPEKQRFGAKKLSLGQIHKRKAHRFA